jgi:hypothetical protein
LILGKFLENQAERSGHFVTADVPGNDPIPPLTIQDNRYCGLTKSKNLKGSDLSSVDLKNFLLFRILLNYCCRKLDASGIRSLQI